MRTLAQIYYDIEKEEQVENQHKKIKGYRDLTEDEIAMMNDAKKLAEQCGKFIEHLQNFPKLDQRWIATGKTDLQKGFMSVIRGIAQPTTF